MSDTELKSLLKAAGNDVILAYREKVKYIPAGIVEVSSSHYSIESAVEWVEVAKFRNFINKYFQALSPIKSDAANRVRKFPFSEPSSPLQDLEPSGPKRARLSLSVENDADVLSSSSPGPCVSEYTPSSPLQAVIVRRKKRCLPKRAERVANGLIEITRQCWVNELKIIKEPLENWPIPENPDYTVAYLLDLMEDEAEYCSPNGGEPMTMAVIIKEACSDSWGSGTGGTVKNATFVVPLNTSCRNVTQACRGCYLCSEVRSDLWEDYERYEYDFETYQKFWNEQREMNAKEAETPFGQAAAFFNSVINSKCPYNNYSCLGKPVLRKFKEMSVDGKFQFIGCSGWHQSHGKFEHTFVRIPPLIKEDLVEELFNDNRVVSGDAQAYTGPCAFLVLPRTGLKQKECPYVHVRIDKLVQGKILPRECPAKLTIYAPVDPAIRKAIIIPKPGLPHNHPSFPAQKATTEAKELYIKAIHASGLMGATTGKVDNAPTTHAIFGNTLPQAQYPCLGNQRLKSDLIRQEKLKRCPNGVGFMGVMHQYREEQQKPLSERYIQYVSTHSSEDHGPNIEIIVTMHPKLVELVHTARSTLHDNTYRRVYGEHNEWEVVMWYERLNRRVNIARIYCNRETRQAYHLIWEAYFKMVEHVTGRKLCMKAFDRTGSLALILTDGHAGQALGLGDYLLTRNDPSISGIIERKPEEIVQYVLRTCDVHCDRNLNELADHVSQSDIEYLRKFRFINSNEDLNTFDNFCTTHAVAKVRDWWKNKANHTWYLASLVRFLSKIPAYEWHSNRGDTNLNEGSHPATNHVTGTQLTLLEAIMSAHRMDERVAQEIAATETTCILPNHLNTNKHRYSKNTQRANTRARKADEQNNARGQLTDINQQITSIKGNLKALEQQKKELKHTSGVRQRRTGIAEKGKTMPEISPPDVDEFPPSLESAALVREIRRSLAGPTTSSLTQFDNPASVALDPALEPPTFTPASYNFLTTSNFPSSSAPATYDTSFPYPNFSPSHVNFNDFNFM